MMEERETPAPRPNDKVRKIKGGFPRFACATYLGGRNKSALSATKRQKSRVRQESYLMVLRYLLLFFS